MDLKVVDYPPEGLIDDWAEIARLLTDHGINFIDTGDYSYVHAEYHPDPPPEQFIDLELDPESVVPGRQDTYPGHEPDIIRRIEICGNVSDGLEPYTNGLLTILVDEVPYSGGHNHIERPMNHHPSPNIFSGATLAEENGEFFCEYEDTCQWGGQYLIRAIYQHGYHTYQVSDTLGILVQNLVDLPEDTLYYHKVGDSRPQHSFTHFVDDDYVNFPREIAIRFNQIMADSFPGDPVPKVEVNDMSLVRGGRYDIGPPRPPNEPLNQYLHWSYPHKTHRIGISMDTNYNGQSGNDSYYDEFKKAIYDTRTEFFPLSDNPHEYPSKNHIHVYFDYYLWE